MRVHRITISYVFLKFNWKLYMKILYMKILYMKIIKRTKLVSK